MYMSLLSRRWKVLSTNEVEHFEWVPFWLASSIIFWRPHLPRGEREGHFRPFFIGGDSRARNPS